MKVLEREISKEWIRDHLRDHPLDYAFRIHDCPWGRKNWDAFLFTPGVCWAVEFKVDRRKAFQYTLDELPAHQHSELLKFVNGTDRKAKVVIYHPGSKEWHE